MGRCYRRCRWKSQEDVRGSLRHPADPPWFSRENPSPSSLPEKRPWHNALALLCCATPNAGSREAVARSVHTAPQTDLAVPFSFSAEVMDCFGIVGTTQTGCQNISSVPSNQVIRQPGASHQPSDCACPHNWVRIGLDWLISVS